jgi:hypothetical protein
VVDCAYGYQKETQDEAHEVEENCGQESGVGRCLDTIKLKSKMTANRSNRQADPVF